MPEIKVILPDDLDKKVRKHMVELDLTSKQKAIIDIIRITVRKNILQKYLTTLKNALAFAVFPS